MSVTPDTSVLAAMERNSASDIFHASAGAPGRSRGAKMEGMVTIGDVVGHFQRGGDSDVGDYINGMYD